MTKMRATPSERLHSVRDAEIFVTWVNGRSSEDSGEPVNIQVDALMLNKTTGLIGFAAPEGIASFGPTPKLVLYCPDYEDVDDTIIKRLSLEPLKVADVLVLNKLLPILDKKPVDLFTQIWTVKRKRLTPEEQAAPAVRKISSEVVKAIKEGKDPLESILGPGEVVFAIQIGRTLHMTGLGEYFVYGSIQEMADVLYPQCLTEFVDSLTPGIKDDEEISPYVLRAFKNFYYETVTSQVEEVKADIEKNREALRKMDRESLQLAVQLGTQAKLVEILSANIKGTATGDSKAETLAKTIAQLSNSQDIASIAIVDRNLEVVFKNVELTYKGMKCPVGDFKAVIRPRTSGDTTVLEFFGVGNNVTHSYFGSYIHPHISGGIPCLGNISNDVRRLLETQDYGMLILLLNEYIRSYNNSNPYRHWFDGNPIAVPITAPSPAPGTTLSPTGHTVVPAPSHPEPDYDDSDEDEYDEDYYENCFQNDYESCRDCHRSGCPYHEERWDSCYESSSDRECAGCAYDDCPHREGAEDRCRETTGSVRSCQGCDASCPFARLEGEACWEVFHDQCEDCENRDDCIAYAAHEEE